MPNYTVSGDADAAVKNKLGAHTHDALETLEAEYVAARRVEIATGHGPSGNFDATHLKAFHYQLFQDVFEWAGRTRDEKARLSDGTAASEPVLRKPDGSPFLPGPRIAAALAKLGADLRAADYLRGLPRQAFAFRAADAFVRINTIHPFREGNGRTQRAFISALAEQAGHELDFTVVSRERMVQVSIAGHDNDPSMMRRLFDEISDPVRVAALEKATRALDRQAFPWNDHYIATTEPGHAVRVTLAGIAGGQFMARTDNAILVGLARDLPAPAPGRGETFGLTPSAWH